MKERPELKIAQIFFQGSLLLIILPIASGLLTSGLLTTGLIKKINFNKSSYLNFPIVEFQNQVSSTYSGLILAAALGSALGLIIYLILKYTADFFEPNFLTRCGQKVPSVSGFLRSLISVLAFPMMIVLAAVSTMVLAKYGLIPRLVIDTEKEIFQVNLQSITTVAALSCMLMFLYEMILKAFLRLFLKS